MVSRVWLVGLAVLGSSLGLAGESFAQQQCNKGPGGAGGGPGGGGNGVVGRGGPGGGFGQGNTTGMFNRPGGPRMNTSTMFGQGNIQQQQLVQQQQRLQMQNLIIQQQQQ